LLTFGQRKIQHFETIFQWLLLGAFVSFLQPVVFFVLTIGQRVSYHCIALANAKI
jgi:hypothetical protein